MTPALLAGQEIVAVDTRRPVPGNLVVFEHPSQSDFWMVKRLADESGWVTSDNDDHEHTDSRTLCRLDLDHPRGAGGCTQHEEARAHTCQAMGSRGVGRHRAKVIRVQGGSPTAA